MKLKNSLRTVNAAFLLSLASSHPDITWATSPDDRPGASVCPEGTAERLAAPPSATDGAFVLNCSLSLAPGSVINRQIVIEGSGASGVTLDCNGASIAGSTATTPAELSTLTVRSKAIPGGWDRPQDVTVKNCRILGSTWIYGMGASGNDPKVRESSLAPGHTERAQAAAPTNIMFMGDQFYTNAKLPFYVAPGATKVTVQYSSFVGRTRTVAIYLDAESADNTVEHNVFDISTDRRELIAVDGSAGNRILNNTFNSIQNGGIYLYRNCGEAGTIRHQTPHGNEISGNEFRVDDDKKPAVWLGSRNGNSKFCFTDPAHLFGSSLSSLDYADDNQVSDNLILGSREDTIRNQGSSNSVVRNTFLERP